MQMCLEKELITGVHLTVHDNMCLQQESRGPRLILTPEIHLNPSYCGEEVGVCKPLLKTCLDCLTCPRPQILY